jgi:hypothetical protein
MEKTYWLQRKMASIAMAKASTSSAARLIHYDLAGRYCLKAQVSDGLGIPLADCLPPAICAGRSNGPSKKAVA